MELRAPGPDDVRDAGDCVRVRWIAARQLARDLDLGRVDVREPHLLRPGGARLRDLDADPVGESRNRELRDTCERVAGVARRNQLLGGLREKRAAQRFSFFLAGIAEHQHHTRSEEHTSELQSRVDISYAVFCLKKTKQHPIRNNTVSTMTTRRPSST